MMPRFNCFYFHLFIICLVVLVAGCIPQKQTVYLQDISLQDRHYTNPYDSLINVTEKYYLMPNDYLFINVSTADPKISEFFNATSTQMGGAQSNYQFFYYLVDDHMDIDFPFAGKINLSGCNLTLAKEKIKQALQPYLKEVNLIVKLANTEYTVLGEVRSPGVKKMNKDQLTIFEAIAIAGDITSYGKRKKVTVLRQTPQGEMTFKVDLTDKNIVNTSVYYIYPNDLIYVRPMKAKSLGIGESFSLGVITSLIATTLAVLTIVNSK